MGGPVSEYASGAVKEGDGEEGGVEDGGNGAGTWYSI